MSLTTACLIVMLASFSTYIGTSIARAIKIRRRDMLLFRLAILNATAKEVNRCPMSTPGTTPTNTR